jgi:hypothetical protein
MTLQGRNDPARAAAILNNTGTNDQILQRMNTLAAPSRAGGPRARPEQMATIVGIEGPSIEETKEPPVQVSIPTPSKHEIHKAPTSPLQVDLGPTLEHAFSGDVQSP